MQLYLNEFLKPWQLGNPDELIEFEFENAELASLVTYIEKKFHLTPFIIDDQISPLPNGGKAVMGTKISFRTYKPMSKKGAWDIFLTFLDMAGLAVVPGLSKMCIELLQAIRAPHYLLTEARSHLL